MSNKSSTIVFNNIKLPFDASVQEAFSVAKKKLRALGLNCKTSEMYVYKRSIDARNKKSIFFVYSIAVKCAVSGIDASNLSKHGAVLVTDGENKFITGTTPMEAPPIIVGSGPAGMYAGVVLAEMGYAPIILERGSCIKERISAVNKFNITHVLDKDTNIQFGAGGAGTFSDGKLVTRTNDSLSSYVLERLIEFGAQEDIKYVAKPHVGTDVLAKVVDNILDRIVALGGKVMYNTKMIDFEADGGHVKSVITDKGIRDALVKCAEEKNIPYQFEILTFGGPDAGAMQTVKSGARTAAVSLPIRYVHTPCETANKNDIEACIALIHDFCRKDFIFN